MHNVFAHASRSTYTTCTLCVGLFVGCNSAPAPAKSAAAKPTTPYPARPTVPPPPIKLFHQSDTTLTLTTKENATDDEIAAILYQLHDAAHTHTFDALHLPQKAIDARKPILWFHIYRGPKCAPEKYADKPPCGASYHAAGDYTLGSYTNPNWDDAELLHNTNTQGDGPETQLWNPDAPPQP